MVLKNLFTGQQWRKKHREQTYGLGEMGREGEMHGKINMGTYIIMCKIGSQTGICCMAQETQTGALYQPRGVGWGGRWERVSKGRRHMYTPWWLRW